MSGWKMRGEFVPLAAIAAVIIFAAIALTLQESIEAEKTILEVIESIAMIVIAAAGVIIASNSFRLQKIERDNSELSIKRDVFRKIANHAVSISSEMLPENNKNESSKNLAKAASGILTLLDMQLEVSHSFNDHDCDVSFDKLIADFGNFMIKYKNAPEIQHDRVSFAEYSLPFLKHITMPNRK